MNQIMNKCRLNDGMETPVSSHTELWAPLSLFPPFPFPGALAVAGGQWAMPGAVEGPSWKQVEDIKEIYNFRDVLGT